MAAMQVFLNPVSTILNGIGQRDAAACDANNHRGCKYARISALPGSCSSPKTRLRLLNIGATSEMVVTIDHHRMIIIQADGVDLEPVEVSIWVWGVLGCAGNLGVRDTWRCRTPGCAGHLGVRDTWVCGTLGCAGHLGVRGTWRCRTLGCAGHLAARDTWVCGTLGSAGHLGVVVQSHRRAKYNLRCGLDELL
jgi:hypothetical protein